MDDTISRQAAIDLAERIETMRLKGEIELTYAPTVKGLKALPPAQPEIIRCKDCKYYEAEENKCLERSYTAMMNDLYGIPTKKQDEIFNTKEIFGTPLAAVEQAINFKLYRWVKEYLITGNDEFRQTGMTTARHLRMLLTDAPNKTYNLSRGLSQTVSRFEFEMCYLRALKQRLAAAGIKTNTIKITGWHGTNYTEVL